MFINLFFKKKKIMTHSRSRVILQILKEAYKTNPNFHVYLCESNPDKSG
jgi:translation initiation factor 2B subunit (eIF-2B alpha/beta/delta family)